MPNTKGKKILVVDDEPDVVSYVRTLLEDNGFQVIEAANGKQGFAQVLAEHPDLVVLDMSMPEESGVRMYRDMQAEPQLERIPVIILTGISHDFKRFIETRKQVRPPDGYFDKPPDREQFLAKINALLGLKAEAAGAK